MLLPIVLLIQNYPLKLTHQVFSLVVLRLKADGQYAQGET